MVKATFSVLSEKDKQLVLETEPKQLRTLDEDELIELHGRVRRARTKHATNYRRQAGAQVVADGSRGAASKKSRQSAARAEVFEDALARVSRRLAAEARASADALRAERLAQAGKGAAAKKRAKGSGSKAKKASRPPADADRKRKRRTPATERSRAQSKASGKRRQATRDAR